MKIHVLSAVMERDIMNLEEYSKVCYIVGIVLQGYFSCWKSKDGYNPIIPVHKTICEKIKNEFNIKIEEGLKDGN